VCGWEEVLPKVDFREARQSGGDKTSENFVFHETRHPTQLEECHGNA
jgi:hypothetical protein